MLKQSAIVIAMTLSIFGCSPSPSSNDNANNENDNLAVDNENDNESTFAWREAFDTTDVGFISAVWGSSSDDVFAVGGQLDQGEVYHFDGTDWQAMQVPEVPVLIWVFGFGPDNVLAAGQNGGLIQYNGDTWQSVDSTTTNDLWGIWGASEDDVWIVGGRVNTGPIVILHYDGQQWSNVDVPALDRESTSLFKVWGTSADHIFAVGQAGVILEYDGQSWEQVESRTTEDLISLWGSGPNRIAAIGGRTNGTIVTYDGTFWASRSLTPLPGLNGIFVEAGNQAVVVGLIGTIASVNLSTFEFIVEPTPTSFTLHAAWGDGDGTVYAVGGLATELPFRGVVLVRQ